MKIENPGSVHCSAYNSEWNVFYSFSSEMKIEWLNRFWVGVPNRTFPRLGL